MPEGGGWCLMWFFFIVLYLSISVFVFIYVYLEHEHFALLDIMRWVGQDYGALGGLIRPRLDAISSMCCPSNVSF